MQNKFHSYVPIFLTVQEYLQICITRYSYMPRKRLYLKSRKSLKLDYNCKLNFKRLIEHCPENPITKDRWNSKKENVNEQNSCNPF